MLKTGLPVVNAGLCGAQIPQEALEVDGRRLVVGAGVALGEPGPDRRFTGNTGTPLMGARAPRPAELMPRRDWSSAALRCDPPRGGGSTRWRHPGGLARARDHTRSRCSQAVGARAEPGPVPGRRNFSGRSRPVREPVGGLHGRLVRRPSWLPGWFGRDRTSEVRL